MGGWRNSRSPHPCMKLCNGKGTMTTPYQQARQQMTETGRKQKGDRRTEARMLQCYMQGQRKCGWMLAKAAQVNNYASLLWDTASHSLKLWPGGNLDDFTARVGACTARPTTRIHDTVHRTTHVHVFVFSFVIILLVLQLEFLEGLDVVDCVQGQHKVIHCVLH